MKKLFLPALVFTVTYFAHSQNAIYYNFTDGNLKADTSIASDGPKVGCTCRPMTSGPTTVAPPSLSAATALNIDPPRVKVSSTKSTRSPATERVRRKRSGRRSVCPLEPSVTKVGMQSARSAAIRLTTSAGAVRCTDGTAQIES